MKQFLIDLLLVLLLICGIQIFFGDYQVSQTLFQRNIDSFEETISQNQQIKENYVSPTDNQDNHVGDFFQMISDLCVQVIQFIVLVFSNLVSLII